MLNSKYWRWLRPRAILRELLSLDDRPHAIALGAALGMWVGMTPTVGIQMPILFVMWLLIRRVVYFNLTASLLMVLISNPLTTPPIYWGSYQLGLMILGGGQELNFAEILSFESFAGWWAAVCDLVYKAGWPLLTGSLVIATVLAVPTYFVMSALLKRFRDPIDVPGHSFAPSSKRLQESRGATEDASKTSKPDYSKAI